MLLIVEVDFLCAHVIHYQKLSKEMTMKRTFRLKQKCHVKICNKQWFGSNFLPNFLELLLQKKI